MRLLPTLALALVSCSQTPGIEHWSDSQHINPRVLPAGFLLGTATSSHQIEGGNDNDWTDWENSTFPDGTPHIKNGDRSGLATDSWNRFDDDLDLMKRLNVNAYRFSLEWSRLEPTRGAWDNAAAARYHEWLTQLRAAGITAVVTIWHYTFPKWVAAQGGFENPATLDDFENFARRVALEFGSDVDLWCTLNEPNVYAYSAYLTGEYPPGKRDTGLFADIMVALMKAHARATQALRSYDTWDADADGSATQIGLAHHVRVFQPATQSTADTTVAGLTDDFFNEAIPRALATGHIKLFLPGERDIDEEIAGLKDSFDYLGLNYYTRDHLRVDLGDASLSKQYVPPGLATNQLGWEIYPDGLYLFLKRMAAWGKPLYVLENGVSDASGESRPQFIRQHFEAVKLAAQQGVDVRGYFYWSLLDNFEWAQGFEPRFGLFKVDYSSPALTRTETPGVEAFRQLLSE